MQITRCACFLVLTLACGQAPASQSSEGISFIVDPKNGNLNVRHRDLTGEQWGGYTPHIRIYNSIVDYRGLFGLRWCSLFETTAVRLPEGNVVVRECGAGRRTYYGVRGAIDAAIVQFVDDRLLPAIGRADEDVRTALGSGTAMRARLLSDPEYRADVAARFELRSEPDMDVRLYKNGRGPQFIRLHDEQLELHEPGLAMVRTFGPDGHLTGFKQRSGPEYELHWDGKRLIDIRSRGRVVVTFGYTSDSLVSHMEWDRGRIEYTYAGERLVAASTSSGRRTYRYTSQGWLSGFDGGDSGAMRATFAAGSGRITEMKIEESGCTDRLAYPKAPVSNDRYAVTLTSTCPDAEAALERTFMYDVRMHPAATRVILVRSRVKSPEGVVEVQYHPAHQQPLRVDEDGWESRYQLDAWGRIVGVRELRGGKETGSRRYEYDERCGAASKIQRSDQTTQFYFDEQCQLIRAERDDQSIQLTYDGAGRISTLNGGEDRVVLVSYEPRFGKPAHVERVGVGEMSVSYDADGVISHVDSPQGPATAVQVASLFGDLQDLIAGADSEEQQIAMKSELGKSCECAPDDFLVQAAVPYAPLGPAAADH